MTYFPQPNPAKRARRVKLGGSVAVAIRSEGTKPVRAKLHSLSATGGLLVLAEALEQGDFVEVAFQTSQGTVHGMAEVLAAQSESSSSCMQPFRFVAMDDADHAKLRMAMDSLFDHSRDIATTKPRSL